MHIMGEGNVLMKIRRVDVQQLCGGVGYTVMGRSVQTMGVGVSRRWVLQIVVIFESRN